MRCEHAQQLFDAYLDGELSPTLATELGAHRVQCPKCRRALALMEVSGHIIASDADPVSLRGSFSNRLLACMEPVHAWSIARFRKTLYTTGILAAAAVIALAFVGVFDPDEGVVAPKVEYGIGVEVEPTADILGGDDSTEVDDPSERALDEFFKQTRMNLKSKRQSGESLQNMLNLTVGQWLDIVQRAEESPAKTDPLGGAGVTIPPAPAEKTPSKPEDIEDL